MLDSIPDDWDDDSVPPFLYPPSRKIGPRGCTGMEKKIAKNSEERRKAPFCDWVVSLTDVCSHTDPKITFGSLVESDVTGTKITTLPVFTVPISESSPGFGFLIFGALTNVTSLKPVEPAFDLPLY